MCADHTTVSAYVGGGGGGLHHLGLFASTPGVRTLKCSPFVMAGGTSYVHSQVGRLVRVSKRVCNRVEGTLAFDPKKQKQSQAKQPFFLKGLQGSQNGCLTGLKGPFDPDVQAGFRGRSERRGRGG